MSPLTIATKNTDKTNDYFSIDPPNTSKTMFNFYKSNNARSRTEAKHPNNSNQGNSHIGNSFKIIRHVSLQSKGEQTEEPVTSNKTVNIANINFDYFVKNKKLDIKSPLNFENSMKSKSLVRKPLIQNVPIYLGVRTNYNVKQNNNHGKKNINFIKYFKL